MKKLTFLIAFCLLFCSKSFSQSLKQETDWLSKKLNVLVLDDEGKNKAGSKPIFSFIGKVMNMNIKNTDSDVSFAMNLQWKLNDVQKVNYKKTTNGNYELMLNVPADRIKVNLGFGNDSNVGGSFKINDKDKENHTSFTLNTKDEAVAKELVNHFEIAVRESKK